MDPITRAAKAFNEQSETYWQSGKGQTLLMVADPAGRLDLSKFLRAYESSLDNRWPLVLFDSPFTDVKGYLHELQQRIITDYAAIRDGVAREGVFFAAYDAPECPAATTNTLMSTMEKVAGLLSVRLAGLHVALMPSRIADSSLWKSLIADLCNRSWSPQVRLAICDTPSGVLSDIFPAQAQAQFAVSEAELIEFFRQAGNQKSAGPPRKSSVPELSTEQRVKVEQDLGRKLLPPPAGTRLRELLLVATQHNRTGEHAAALRSYLEAQKLCQEHEVVHEEIMVLMALASGYLALSDPEQALVTYRRAAELSHAIGMKPLAGHAWLGVAGVLFMLGRYLPAALSYEQAAEAARQAQVPMLHIEALRMAGTSYHQLGRTQDVVRCWQAATVEGQALPSEARAATTFPQVAAELVKLLRKHGLHEQATYIQSLIEPPASAAAAGI